MEHPKPQPSRAQRVSTWRFWAIGLVAVAIISYLALGTDIFSGSEEINTNINSNTKSAKGLATRQDYIGIMTDFGYQFSEGAEINGNPNWIGINEQSFVQLKGEDKGLYEAYFYCIFSEDPIDNAHWQAAMQTFTGISDEEAADWAMEFWDLLFEEDDFVQSLNKDFGGNSYTVSGTEEGGTRGFSVALMNELFQY